MTMPGMTNAEKAAYYLKEFERWADEVAQHMKLSRRVGENEARARCEDHRMIDFYAEDDMSRNPWALIAKGKRDAMLARANLYASLAIMDQLNAQQSTERLL